MNPIVTVREARGLSRTELCLALGVGYGVVTDLETGRSPGVPASVWAGLEKLGEEPRKIADEYARWRETRRAALIGG